ncbi:MAG TPA: helix-turn-helix transcriptional regulator, partial [Candidatus Kapabacteria bacterium]|nr:helix-turn-helix transcriptional regulator [Candidatus Kapabacteria bacterium]
ITFLNRLPITSDRSRWMDELRAALLKLFPDVDRIAININVYCDPIRPPEMCDDVISVRISNNGKKEGLAITPLAGTSITEEFEVETGKFVPLEKYHPPKYFHYFHESGQYYGSMIFFREIEKPKTPHKTFETMASLEPFIKYIYASFLAMQNAAKPFGAAFRDAQSKMEHEAGFSTQESKVMTLTLCGYSYKQIASHLDISLNTVRSHIKSIHKKTGTRSYTELFAKYFVPVAGEHLP